MTKRALLWHAIVAEVGEPATTSERGRINSAVKELCEIDATPDDVRARSDRYRKLWPDIVLTARALANNWSLLDPTRRTQRESDYDDMRNDMRKYTRA
jgi:hypothetical protein